MPDLRLRILVPTLFCCLAVGCTGEESSTPARSIREQITVLRDEGQRPGEDAWPRIVELCRSSRLIHEAVAAGQPTTVNEDEAPRPDYFRIIGDSFSESAEVGVERAALERLEAEGVFQLLAEIAACPRAAKPIPSDGLLLSRDAEYLRDCQQIAKAAMASGKLALMAGDDGLFVMRVEQTLGLGRLISHQPSHMEWLVGITCWHAGLGQVRAALQDDRLSEQSCARLLAVIGADEPAPATKMYRAERLIALDVIDRTYTLDDDGDGEVDADRLSAATSGVGAFGIGAVPGVLAGRREMMTKIDEYFGPAIEAAEKPTHEREDLHDHSRDFQDRLSDRHAALLNVILPSIEYPIRSAELGELQTAGTQIMLALEIYRSRQGEYPESLDLLVPEILEELPVDPHSGWPLRYRLLENDPYARGYLLYSVGADGIDHGGQCPPDEPGRGLTVRPGEANDFIVNQPPRPRADG